jgi:glutamyl-tRNA synthetase
LHSAAQLFDFDRVNKAGARFDWDKLNWLNSQYIHKLPISDLCDRLIPFWQSAGYDCNRERTWLEALTQLIAPSLTVLKDAVAITEFFFVDMPKYSDEALKVLTSEGVADLIRAIATELQSYPSEHFTAQQAEEVIQSVVTALKVKKGAVMKPLRAVLSGATKGPEIIPSFVLLHQQKLAMPRLAKFAN